MIVELHSPSVGSLSYLTTRNACRGMNLIELDQLLRGIDADSSPPIVCRTQMSLLFHLENHRREILLLSQVRLPCVNLKSSSGRGHSHSDSSREIENQPEILVH